MYWDKGLSRVIKVHHLLHGMAETGNIVGWVCTPISWSSRRRLTNNIYRIRPFSGLSTYKCWWGWGIPARKSSWHTYCNLLPRSFMKRDSSDLSIILIFETNWNHRRSTNLRTNKWGPEHQPSTATAAVPLAVISFDGRSLNVFSIKNATSPVQSKERLQPVPP
jgi:hypothetical protein